MNLRTRHELFAFHWDPNAPTAEVAIPHMHLGFSMRDESLPINNKALLPSGRVPIEDVVSFVITELAVKPLQPEWQVTIQKAREAFMAYKTW